MDLKTLHNSNFVKFLIFLDNFENFIKFCNILKYQCSFGLAKKIL